jgi:hypothetical protein
MVAFQGGHPPFKGNSPQGRWLNIFSGSPQSLEKSFFRRSMTTSGYTTIFTKKEKKLKICRDE